MLGSKKVRSQVEQLTNYKGSRELELPPFLVTHLSCCIYNSEVLSTDLQTGISQNYFTMFYKGLKISQNRARTEQIWGWQWEVALLRWST